METRDLTEPSRRRISRRCRPRNESAREYSVYDGQKCIGIFIVDDKTGKAKAFNAAGRSLGKFAGYDAARKAVSEAYRDAMARRATTAQALEHLNRRTVEFVSGMPDHSLGRRV